MEYLNITETAKKWGISPRRLQTLCANGKVEGATRFGKAWMIPKTTEKPIDGRTKASRSSADPLLEKNMPMPRKTPFLHMTDLYSAAGSAEKSIAALAGNPEAHTLLEAEIAYSKGEIEKVYDNAYYLLHKHSGFYAVISAGMLLGLCAIWRGDLNMWRQAKIHIAEAPAKSEADRDIMVFSITALDKAGFGDVDAGIKAYKIADGNAKRFGFVLCTHDLIQHHFHGIPGTGSVIVLSVYVEGSVGHLEGTFINLAVTGVYTHAFGFHVIGI